MRLRLRSGAAPWWASLTNRRARGANAAVVQFTHTVIDITTEQGNKTQPAVRCCPLVIQFWWRGTVVERRSLTGELFLSCARPAADG